MNCSPKLLHLCTKNGINRVEDSGKDNISTDQEEDNTYVEQDFHRAFLKCAGVSAAAVGSASLLSGCKTNGSNTTVNDVKVGDTVKNWNGLGVQLSSVFHLTQDPAQPGYEYLGVRVTVLNRSKTETYTIGAQGVDAINAAYPVPPLSNVDANFQSFSDSESLPPQGSGYIVLMLMVPKNWKELQVTYMPTFAPDKTLTFTMKAADVIRG